MRRRRPRPRDWKRSCGTDAEGAGATGTKRGSDAGSNVGTRVHRLLHPRRFNQIPRHVRRPSDAIAILRAEIGCAFDVLRRAMEANLCQHYQTLLAGLGRSVPAHAYAAAVERLRSERDAALGHLRALLRMQERRQLECALGTMRRVRRLNRVRPLASGAAREFVNAAGEVVRRASRSRANRQAARSAPRPAAPRGPLSLRSGLP